MRNDYLALPFLLFYVVYKLNFFGLEGQFDGDHSIQKAAEGPDVRLCCEGAALGNLWRHVATGPH